MPTKLSRYSQGIMEAAWLAAIVVIPVFFNVYSSRIFEPDKLTLLRSLSLLILAAWIIKLLEDRGNVSERTGSWVLELWKTPLLPQVLGLAVVYIIATLFSVTPRVSFWGSYQRLQGTYTTLSYLVIFGAIAANMRRREQVERFITAAVLASLPVALYGILQRFGRDPVPWGGDVTIRIAANMGNSIFVAAYLIMTVPLTIGRIISSFGAILQEEEDEGLGTHVARGTVYVFIFSVQLIAIYMSQSRGPLLGLLAGIFLLFTILSLYWQKRWLTISVVGLTALAGLFLLVLSIPNGPLQSLRSVEGIGRFGRVFELDRSTGRVRVLIWEGATELVAPHDPLTFPDGSTDSVNFLRPLIGYGPESMYVAYNSFYPPELATIESRNASPDRSHNETWDAVVITGLLGLFAYLAVFSSLFYYGLKWLGMINSPRLKQLFFGLLFGGGLLSVIGFVLWGGWAFFGVGLPFGILIGLIGYLTLAALFTEYEAPTSPGERTRALILMVALAAIVAHFVEIHFGIAIAATRTYFWAYAGMILAAGYFMTQEKAFADTDVSAAEAKTSKVKKVARKKKGTRRMRHGGSEGAIQPWLREAYIAGGITAILLLTLGFNFISNTDRYTSIVDVIVKSITILPNENDAVSYGIIAMIFTGVIFSVVAFTGETANRSKETPWRNSLLVSLLFALVIGLSFWVFHAASLVSLARGIIPNVGFDNPVIAQSFQIESLLSKYYGYLFFVVLILAYVLVDTSSGKLINQTGFGIGAAILLIGVVPWAISVTNVRIIRADIAFKIAEPFSRGNSPEEQQVAIDLHRRAIELAPSEDHYYLFLGRSYLELARLLQNENPAESESLMSQAEVDLKRAQNINPLNTDHTANLARLFRFWVALTPDPDLRLERATSASEFYEKAIILSPNNAVIRNELALLYLSAFDDRERGFELLEESIEVDPFYGATYGLIADFYAQESRPLEAGDEKESLIEQSAANYTKAVELTRVKKDGAGEGEKYNYLTSLGSLYSENQQLELAVEYFIQALEFGRNNQIWQVEQVIARVYAQLGDDASAMLYATRALQNAPEDRRAEVQALINLLQQSSP